MRREYRVHGHATLQQEGADLIDNAGTLTDNRSRMRWSVCKSTCSAIFVATKSCCPASVVQLRSAGRSHWYDRDDLVTAVDDGDDVCAGSCVITIGRPHGRARLLR